MQHLDVISPLIKKKGVLAMLAKPLFFIIVSFYILCNLNTQSYTVHKDT